MSDGRPDWGVASVVAARADDPNGVQGVTPAYTGCDCDWCVAFWADVRKRLGHE